MSFQAYSIAAPDGVRLAVRESGNPAGPALIFIHGFSQCQLAFAKQVASPLLQQYRIVTYDLRGHGESDKPADAQSYTEGKHWADDLQAVIDGLGLVKPVLVGWSMGGRVICQYVLQYGDGAIGAIHFVAARTVVDPAIAVLGEGGHFLMAMRSVQTELNIAATSGFIRSCVHRALTAEEFEWMLAYNMLVPPEVRAAALAWPGNFMQVLQKISVPTLIAHGMQDRITLPYAAQLTAAQVGHARLSWYDDIGHSPFWEAPERFNRELAELIDSLGESPA